MGGEHQSSNEVARLVISSVMTYLQLKPESTVPTLTYGPARMVIVLDAAVSEEWQAQVSEWIVRSGCLYVMAWGINCSAWDDAVDWANIDQFENAASIPEASLVLTTWHDDDALEEVFQFAKNCAFHPVATLESTIILHISQEERSEELLRAYAAA